MSKPEILNNTCMGCKAHVHTSRIAIHRCRGPSDLERVIRCTFHPDLTTEQAEDVQNRVARVIEEVRAEVEAELKELRSALELIADGFDHDEDAHKYGTPCRECVAKKALKRTT